MTDGVLSSLYSLGNRAKRRIKDVARSPLANIEQVSDEIRRRLIADPTSTVLESANIGGLGVIKPKGGNWLTGSVEDALRGLKRDVPPHAQNFDETVGRQGSINRWIEGPLTKYVKTRMASPEDEVRKLAEQGVLHYEPEITGWVPEGPGILAPKRHASTTLGKQWEDISDNAIRGLPAKDVRRLAQNNVYLHAFGKKPKELLAENPWIGKAPRDEMVYSADASPTELGFPHLIDELSNALNPASGLPRNLRLTPEAMQNLSMEKAVRRVADINAWRSEQAALAEKKAAEEILKRDALRSYDDQWRWLAIPDTATPEGLALAKDIGCRGGWCTMGDDAALRYGSGDQRLYALIDETGRPHTQIRIETTPSFKEGENIQYIREIKPPENTWEGSRVKTYAERNPEYKNRVQAAMQDFVRNNPLGGQWSEVGDLGNTGLLRRSDILSGKLDPSFAGRPISLEDYEAARKKFATELPQDAPEYGTADEWLKFMGFAQGGSVSHDPRVPGGGIRGNSVKASIKSQPVPTAGTTQLPQGTEQLGPRAETQPIRTASQLREILEQLMQEHEYA